MSSFLKVSFFSGCLTLFKMLAGFLIAKVIAIYTGPSGMALLGQLQSFVIGINGVVNAPVGNGIVKYTAEFNSKGTEICSQWWKPAIFISFLFSFILFAIGIPFAREISSVLLGTHEYTYVMIIALCNLPFTAIGTMIMSIINGKGHYKIYILYGFVSTLLASIIMLIMLITLGIKGALLSTSLQYGLIGIILIAANYRKDWFKIRFFFQRFRKKEAKDISSFILMALTSAISLPLTLIAIRGMLISYANIDVAGQWQAVWKISEAYIGVITVALSTYFLPKLSSLNNNVDAIKKEINMVLKYIIPFVFIIAILIFIMRDVIIAILFTKEFYIARDLFAVQLIGDIIKIISWVFAFTMLSTKATRWYIGTEILFCISWVMISYAVIGQYGAQGINVAYAFSYFIYFIIIYFNFDRIVKPEIGNHTS